MQGQPCCRRAGAWEEVLLRGLALNPDCISLTPCLALLLLRGESELASFNQSSQDRTGKKIRRGQQEREGNTASFLGLSGFVTVLPP